MNSGSRKPTTNGQLEKLEYRLNIKGSPPPNMTFVRECVNFRGQIQQKKKKVSIKREINITKC